MADKCDFSKCMFEGELRVLWELGKGSHGEVSLVEDSSSQEFGVKTVPVRSPTVQLLEHEFKIYKHLQCDKKKIAGLPQVFKCGLDHLHGKHVLVMSRLGASMRDVMDLNRMPIPEYACLRIGCQLIRRLQYVHDMGLVHGDVKPRNILCGHETFEKIYLVDFGLASFYRNFKSGKHHSLVKGQKFKGTEDFASRSAHKGVSLSRRDDLESLGFTLIYMMNGRLPWSKSRIGNDRSWRGITEDEVQLVHEDIRSKKEMNVATMKESTSIEVLCEGLPECMTTFMKCVYGLAFDEAPDYSFLIKVMEERMHYLKSMNDENNGNELVIWTVPYERTRYLRIRKDKDLWANFVSEQASGEEGNETNSQQDNGNDLRNEIDPTEEPTQDTNDKISCNPLCCLRGTERDRLSQDEGSKEGSEVSSIQPHPVLYRNSPIWWKRLLVFLKVRKPSPPTVLLHYSDEGFYSETQQREW